MIMIGIAITILIIRVVVIILHQSLSRRQRKNILNDPRIANQIKIWIENGMKPTGRFLPEPYLHPLNNILVEIDSLQGKLLLRKYSHSQVTGYICINIPKDLIPPEVSYKSSFTYE